MRRLLLGASLTAAVLAVVPASASAHGLVGRLDLPVPQWLFAWAAAVVLVASFVGLAVAWRTPRLEGAGSRRIVGIPAIVASVVRAVGLAAFSLVVVAGLVGEQEPSRNIAPTIVYVVFWVGVPIVSVLVGDVFRALSPWRSVGMLVARSTSTDRVRAYPARVGRWPAAGGIVAFAWIELVAPFGDQPRVVAGLAVAYFVVQLWGIRRYGVEPWSTNADAFGVAFSLVAAMAPLSWRDGELHVRRPLSGLAAAATPVGTVGILCALIGTTSFDGASGHEIWSTYAPGWYGAIRDLGASPDLARAVVDTLGLLASIALVSGIYRLGVRGMLSRRPGIDGRRLAARFAPSLVPIVVAYVVAHYFSLLVFQGQALGFMASDPLATGADLFGTASWTVDLGVVSAAAIWYVQAGALIAGHVAALAAAHDRSLVLFRRRRDAARSQYWMLSVMVGYTCLGLWLLSSVGT